MLYRNTGSDTRSGILEAAAAVVAERGLDAATTREICDRAGVSAPTLYHHFGDKQGLMDAVVTLAYERYLTRKRALRPTGNAREDLRRGWDAHVAFARANPVLYQLMWPAGSTELPEAARTSAALLRERFEELESAGALRSGTTPGQATRALSAALRGVTAAITRDPTNRDNVRLSETVRDAIVDALLVAEPAD
ncbi:MAG: TetR/AcrR family transcriptional regulator [Gemmatimonadota bacterium]|jgi:AcrR family transcriptional regulator